MSALTIKAECMGGSSISNACDEAISLAKKLGVTVEFEFNGVTCFAQTDGDATTLESKWREAMESERTYKIASSR